MVILTFPACSSGPPPNKVSGKIVYNQQPLKSYEGINVIFVPVVEAGKEHDNYVADVSREDGSFNVPGRDGKGIPAGKYKVAVNTQLMSPKAGFDTQKIGDMFTAEKTQISVEVAGETTLTIDLSKPTGK